MPGSIPAWSAWADNIDLHMLWMVLIQAASMPRAASPKPWARSSARTRPSSSAAALLVKVMVSTLSTPGSSGPLSSESPWARRLVRVKVLPVPAPACMNSGVPAWRTACCWLGVSPIV